METKRRRRASRPSAKLPFANSASETMDAYSIKVMKDLIKDKTLMKYKVTLEKILKYMINAKDNEQRCSDKCKDLVAEIAANSAKIQAAMLLSEEDKTTINTLNKELEKSWKMGEEFCRNEKIARDTIQNLKAELAKVKRNATRESSVSSELKNALSKQRELRQRNETLTSEIEKIQTEYGKLMENLKNAETENGLLRQQIDRAKKELCSKDIKYEKEIKRAGKLERELSRFKRELEEKETLLKSLDEDEIIKKEGITKLMRQLKLKTVKLEKTAKELELVKATLSDMQTEQVRIQNGERVRDLREELEKKSKELEDKAANIITLRKTIDNMKKQQKTDLQRMRVSKTQNSEGTLMTLQTENRTFLRQRDEAKDRCEELENELALLKGEKEKLAKTISQSVVDAQNMQSKLLTQEHLRHHLNMRIRELQEEISVQAKTIAQVEGERNKCISKISDLETHIYHLEERMGKKKNLGPFGKLAETERKLYETQKSLEDSQEQRDYYQEKWKLSIEQVADLKCDMDKYIKQITCLKEQLNLQEKLEEKVTQLALDVKSQCKGGIMLVSCTKKDDGDAQDAVENAMISVAEEPRRVDEREANDGKGDYEGIGDQNEVADQKETVNQISPKMNGETTLAVQELSEQNECHTMVIDLPKYLESDQEEENFSDLEGPPEDENQSRTEFDSESLKNSVELGRQKICTKPEEVEYSSFEKISSDDFNTDPLETKNQVQHVTKEEVVQTDNDFMTPPETKCYQKLEHRSFARMQDHSKQRQNALLDAERQDILKKMRALQRQLTSKTQEVVQQNITIQEKDKLLEAMQKAIRRLKQADVIENCKVEMEEKDRRMNALERRLRMYEGYIGDYQNEIDRLNKTVSHTRNRRHNAAVMEIAAVHKAFKRVPKVQRGLPQVPVEQKKKFRGGGFRIS